jgi:hypothetical protein
MNCASIVFAQVHPSIFVAPGNWDITSDYVWARGTESVNKFSQSEEVKQGGMKCHDMHG